MPLLRVVLDLGASAVIHADSLMHLPDDVLAALKPGVRLVDTTLLLRIRDSQMSEQSSLEQLAHRASEVLELIGQGAGNEDIAERLYISENTAKNHVHTIREKLGVKNRVKLAVVSQGLGWRFGL